MNCQYREHDVLQALSTPSYGNNLEHIKLSFANHPTHDETCLQLIECVFHDAAPRVTDERACNQLHQGSLKPTTDHVTP